MKNLKKIGALIIATMLILAMAAPAMAATVTGDTFTYTGDDKTADGKIIMSNATKDVTYTLYKIFDATYSGDNVSYTIKEDYAVFGNLDADYFTVSSQKDADGNYAVTRTGTTAEDGTFTPTKSDSDLIDYLQTITAKFIEIGGIKSTVNGEIKWENIPYGYYYIKPDQPVADAAVTIDSNTPTVTVIDKNQIPDASKEIIVGGQASDVNEAGLNIDVPFEITVDAKNYEGTSKIYQYTVKDTLGAGFTIKAAPVVKIFDASEDEPDAATTSGYTIKYYTDDTKTTETTTLSEAQYFEIVFPWTDNGAVDGDHIYAANTTIKVTYTAILDPAKADKVNYGTANTNDLTVTWLKEDEPEGEIVEPSTETFNTSISIQKTDGSNGLSGAEFELSTENGTTVAYITEGETFVKVTGTASGTVYYKLKDGTYTTTAPTTGTANLYDSTEDKYEKVSMFTAGNGQPSASTMKAFVDDSGKLTFKGLGAGTYTLKETVVPKGYNKADDITFTITFDPATKTFDCDNDSITLDASTNLFGTEVVNNKGSELPATGGIGTRIFYIVGAILALGAGIVLVTRRRAGDR